MIAISGFLTTLECTEFVFAYSAPQTFYSWFKGATSKGRRGKGEGKMKGKERKGCEGGPAPLTQIPGTAPVDRHRVPIYFLFCWSWYQNKNKNTARQMHLTLHIHFS